jgi:hypothetical protein
VYSADEIPAASQATMIRREIPDDESGNRHCAEGDARGNFIYDPLGKDTFTGKETVQFDSFKFYTPKQGEL